VPLASGALAVASSSPSDQLVCAPREPLAHAAVRHFDAREMKVRRRDVEQQRARNHRRAWIRTSQRPRRRPAVGRCDGRRICRRRARLSRLERRTRSASSRITAAACGARARVERQARQLETRDAHAHDRAVAGELPARVGEAATCAPRDAERARTTARPTRTRVARRVSRSVLARRSRRGGAARRDRRAAPRRPRAPPLGTQLRFDLLQLRRASRLARDEPQHVVAAAVRTGSATSRARAPPAPRRRGPRYSRSFAAGRGASGSLATVRRRVLACTSAAATPSRKRAAACARGRVGAVGVAALARRPVRRAASRRGNSLIRVEEGAQRGGVRLADRRRPSPTRSAPPPGRPHAPVLGAPRVQCALHQQLSSTRRSST